MLGAGDGKEPLSRSIAIVLIFGSSGIFFTGLFVVSAVSGPPAQGSGLYIPAAILSFAVAASSRKLAAPFLTGLFPVIRKGPRVIKVLFASYAVGIVALILVFMVALFVLGSEHAEALILNHPRLVVLIGGMIAAPFMWKYLK